MGSGDGGEDCKKFRSRQKFGFEPLFKWSFEWRVLYLIENVEFHWKKVRIEGGQKEEEDRT